MAFQCPPLPGMTPEETPAYQTAKDDPLKCRQFSATRKFFRKVKADPDSVTAADMKDVTSDYALDFAEQLLYLKTLVRLGLNS